MTTPQKAAIEALEALSRISMALHDPHFQIDQADFDTVRSALRANQGCEVTVEEYLHGFIATINKIEIDKECAVYKFLMEANSRHTKYIQERFPSGLRIVQTDKGEG